MNLSTNQSKVLKRIAKAGEIDIVDFDQRTVNSLGKRGLIRVSGRGIAKPTKKAKKLFN